MDTRTGDIFRGELADQIPEQFRKELAAQQIEALKIRQRRELEATGHTKVGRNDPCPCGSGKKFKKCCLNAE